MKILITGATGLLGKKIGLELHQQGHEIVVISRNAQKASAELPFQAEVITWDEMSDKKVLGSKIDVVINLVGESVADGRWSEERKKSLVSSRVGLTQKVLAWVSPQARVISASAVGIYGHQGTEKIEGIEFLKKLCQDWEHSVLHRPGSLVFRLGVVISSEGGALTKMLLPFKMGVGGAVGSGQQMMSWIHWKDAVGAFVSAVNHPEWTGVMNLTAPNPVSNLEFSKSLAQTLHRPLGPKVPIFAIKLLFGEMSAVVLASQDARPIELLEKGFSFQFLRIDEALAETLS